MTYTVSSGTLNPSIPYHASRARRPVAMYNNVDAVQLGSAVHKPYDSCTNKTSVLLAIVTVKIKTVGLYFVYTVTYIL